MEYLGEFLTVALIHFLAVASPGPDFAVTLKQSISNGRRAGVLTSLGIGAGIFVHVAYCIVGLGVLISQSILLFSIVKYVGAAYLIYIGLSALRAKPVGNLEESQQTQDKTKGAFQLGFLTNALNPKATLFFLSVFSVVVSPETPATIQLLYGVWMAFATSIWFGALSILFSHSRVLKMFEKIGHWFERVMGTFLIGLGAKLALSDM